MSEGATLFSVPPVNRGTPASRPTAGADARKVEQSSREFESILVGQWLTAAEHSFASVPGSDQGSDPGADQFQQLAMQALARSLTAAGGLGLAHLVANGLSHEPANGVPPQSSPSAVAQAAGATILTQPFPPANSEPR